MPNEQPTLITSDPLVLHGQSRVAGTRIPVSVVLDCLAAGMSESEMLAEYPVPDGGGNPGGCQLRGATSLERGTGVSGRR